MRTDENTFATKEQKIGYVNATPNPLHLIIPPADPYHKNSHLFPVVYKAVSQGISDGNGSEE